MSKDMMDMHDSVMKKFGLLLSVITLVSCAGMVEKNIHVNDAVDMPVPYNTDMTLQLYGVQLMDNIEKVHTMYRPYDCDGTREIRLNCFYALDTTESKALELGDDARLMVSYLRSEVDMVGLVLSPETYAVMKDKLMAYYGDAASETVDVTTWSGAGGNVELYHQQHLNGYYGMQIKRVK